MQDSELNDRLNRAELLEIKICWLTLKTRSFRYKEAETLALQALDTCKQRVSGSAPVLVDVQSILAQIYIAQVREVFFWFLRFFFNFFFLLELDFKHSFSTLFLSSAPIPISRVTTAMPK